MRSLGAAVAFLTRIPVVVGQPHTAEELGRAAPWFPLVGAGIGAAAATAQLLLSPLVPPLVVGVLVVSIQALLTGGLHLDGLADTADGFGAGRTREDVLCIMRDHAIGAYGAMTLVLVLLLKVAAVAVLVERGEAFASLVAAGALSRWAAVALGSVLPYARRTPEEGRKPEGAIPDFIGARELVFASAASAAVVALSIPWHGLVCWLGAAATGAASATACRRRIGGVTGDTLGATVEISEAAVLVARLALT